MAAERGLCPSIVHNRHPSKNKREPVKSDAFQVARKKGREKEKKRKQKYEKGAWNSSRSSSRRDDVGRRPSAAYFPARRRATPLTSRRRHRRRRIPPPPPPPPPKKKRLHFEDFLCFNTYSSLIDVTLLMATSFSFFFSINRSKFDRPFSFWRRRGQQSTSFPRIALIQHLSFVNRCGTIVGWLWNLLLTILRYYDYFNKENISVDDD